MSNLKEQLIRLGAESPELQNDIKKVLDHVQKEGFSFGDPAQVAKRLGDYLEMQAEGLNRMRGDRDLVNAIDSIVEKLQSVKRSL